MKHFVQARIGQPVAGHEDCRFYERAVAWDRTSEQGSMIMTQFDPIRRSYNGAAVSWWAFMLLGVLLIVLGLIALGMVGYASLISVMMIGWLLLIAGIAQPFVTLDTSSRSFFVHLLIGIFYAVVGLLILLHPGVTLVTMTLMLAVLLVSGGLVRIIAGALHREHRVWLIIGGAVTLLLGLLIWAGWPENALWVLGMFLGLDLLMTGVTWVAVALTIRPEAHPRVPPVAT